MRPGAQRRLVIAFAVVSFTMLTVIPAPAYVFLAGNPRWPDGHIVMHTQLGSSGTLTDGASSWGASAEDAMSMWNRYLDRAQFTIVRDSTSPVGDGNGINNMFWSSTIYGKPFTSVGSGIGFGPLAVTTNWTRSGTRTEADIIFNNQYFFNSYRGTLRSGTTTGRTYDFHRVAIHELGHVLGLDHPDQYGQNVVSIMNANTSDVDALTTDDISGGRALYASVFGNGTIAFPPQNETLSFRSQLETEYRTVLRRNPTITTYVDTTGDAVWTSEYLRYRVNQCSNGAATQHVLDTINGLGTASVCGSSPAGQVDFPPRNEALDFRNQLETTYRDGLRRGPSLTAVDNEGDVVWTQEYLRYRVNACDHQTSVGKVFLQIEGRGIQPVCR